MTGSRSAALAAKTLRQTVCRLDGQTIAPGHRSLPAAAAAAAAGLLDLTIGLLSPTGSWPPSLEQTPENLLPYVGDETAELIDALDQLRPPGVGDETRQADPQVVLVTALAPHLLWRLASSGYEVMQLVEGLRSRLYLSDDQFAVQVIRLAPVLVLTTAESQYRLDLVTQTEPCDQHILPSDLELQLLDNDLDLQRFAVGRLLQRVEQQIYHAAPPLGPFIQDGWAIDCLLPGQRWQSGRLQLQLALMQVGPGRLRAAAGGLVAPALGPHAGAPPPVSQPRGGDAETFTIDDFADSLTSQAGPQTGGLMGDWLTFTNEAWIQTFLRSNAQRTLTPALMALACSPTAWSHETTLSLDCVRAVYRTATAVIGQNELFNHTFVHRSLLLADVWPRLRWYLAQSSERVMQLMGGMAAAALQPGLPWQSGNLFLRPLLTLQLDPQIWHIDLSSGRLLMGLPFALVPEAVVELSDPYPWPATLTADQLLATITADIEQGAPALAQLRQGTDVTLHQVETGDGSQAGRLSLDWLVTLQSLS